MKNSRYHCANKVFTIKLQEARPTAKHEAISALVDQLDPLCDDAPDTYTSIPPSAQQQLLRAIACPFCLKVTWTMGSRKQRFIVSQTSFAFGTTLKLEMKREIAARRDPGRPYMHLEGLL